MGFVPVHSIKDLRLALKSIRFYSSSCLLMYFFTQTMIMLSIKHRISSEKLDSRTCTGQFKIMLRLSGGQPKIYSQKSLFHFSLLKTDTADNDYTQFTLLFTSTCFRMWELTGNQKLWRTTRNYNVVVRGQFLLFF